MLLIFPIASPDIMVPRCSIKTPLIRTVLWQRQRPKVGRTYFPSFNNESCRRTKVRTSYHIKLIYVTGELTLPQSNMLLTATTTTQKMQKSRYTSNWFRNHNPKERDIGNCTIIS